MQVGKQKQKLEWEVEVLYEQECSKCEHQFTVSCLYKDRDIPKFCPKCGKIADRLLSCPAILGTRDSFGIKNEFQDDDTGQTIDNWKTWEKAGYRNPVETTKNHAMKEKIKDNIKKRKNK